MLVFVNEILLNVAGIMFPALHVERGLLAIRVSEDRVMDVSKSMRVTVGGRSLPYDLILEIVLPENLVEHDLDVMGGVPVAVVVEAAGLFEDAGQLFATRPHVINVSPGVLVPVFKRTLLLGLAPEDFVVAVGVEGRVNVTEVHAGVGELAELFEAIAAVNEERVHQRGGPRGGFGSVFLQPRRLRRGVSGIRALFRSHGPTIWGSQPVVDRKSVGE